MSTIQRIVKNAGVLYASHVITSVLSLVLLIFIARILGDVILGKYSFAVAFTAFFAVFLDFGLETIIIRDVARDKTLAPKYLGNIAVIKAILSIIVFGVISLIINLMHYPSDTTTAVFIFSSCIVITSFSGIFRVNFKAFERMEFEALATAISRFVSVSLGLAALFIGYGLIGIACAFLFGRIFDLLFSFFICTIKFFKPRFQIDRNLLMKVIKAALPVGLSYTAHTTYGRIDTIMLSFMKGDAVVGWYSAAHSLTLSLQPIFQVFGITVLPVMASLFISSISSLRVAYEKTFHYLFILALPLAVGTMLLSERIILLFYGAEFRNSIVALQILSWDILFYAMCSVLFRVLISINRQNQMAVAAGACAVLNIILNLIFIPWFSYIGAGIATIITKMILFGLLFYFTSKHLYRLPLNKIVFKPIIACVIMATFIYFCQSFNLAMLIVLSIVIYFASFILIKGFTKEDWKLIAQVIPKKRVN